MRDKSAIEACLAACVPDRPVLIAGPTASGKSALALAIAERQGGIIVNADAIQVFSDWRVLTARPSAEDEARAPHALYGHVPGDHAYSVGEWLREAATFLNAPERPIFTGGTGLYLTALTEGLAEIPPTPPQVRAEGEAMLADRGLQAMIADLDERTAARIDLDNPARVARAWEVLRATGRGLADWQAETPPPLLPLDQANAFVVEAPKDWLTPRIARRFDQMIDAGALDEARANRPGWSPDRPSAKAIGAAELMAYLDGDMTLAAAKERATILTRQFAKRQRTWFRARMGHWHSLSARDLA
ncbi:tRNA dimethylallyltransferase [Mameliella alba]|uniref:tRNA (adenosine(37)-N6)-dimethylallyltransferase MiaA n=1 Tax=Mameliella alba TaxID=561184 RepID=UPI00087FAE82|nr:tRNA (adenosine(37)-N6)-dimethylallyltransferase MiaA [Mameliella alba]OWV50201.1 tRNA (adenosine(37)-N6)-dimethylallyltransferase MiaA [Mameliella alba]PTR42407.1 tRNA dimethylallyltransferase [Mameliella alba]GGF57517.1 tRNA dimethylallyltransferase [Mameliella alba]SDC09434.1 tRNA dimethylallyltransferase [Mameliella alba]